MKNTVEEIQTMLETVELLKELVYMTTATPMLEGVKEWERIIRGVFEIQEHLEIELIAVKEIQFIED